MGKYYITEVKTNKDIKQWLDFPARLYKNDPHYVKPLDDEIEAIFDKSKNKLFRHGDAIRFILKDKDGNVIGRIAAFYDEKTSNTYNKEENGQPTGGCGFFDCINDQEAADMLFDAAKQWNIEHGQEAMDGPINFGDRDYFWGCLYDGFTDPVYNMPYNFPYYNQLFENYGFKIFFKQLTYRRLFSLDGIDPILHEKAKRFYGNPSYSFEILDKRNIDKYADDFLIIYNKAWGSIPGSTKLTRQHAIGLLNSLKPIIDPRLMHFAYHIDENGNKDDVKYILSLYEKYLRKSNVFDEPFSIEHVHKDTGTDAYCKIGNLICLDADENSRLGTKPASAKIPTYKVSQFETAKKIAKDYNGKWEQTQIDERGKEIAQILYYDIWKVKSKEIA